MSAPQAPLPDARQLLRTAQNDRNAARESVAALDEDAQLGLVCSAAPRDRMGLLDLMENPERVVARLPEAELCFTVKAVGLESAAWLLDQATSEQIVAAVDLDVWDGPRVQPVMIDAWLAAIASTSDESVLEAFDSLDDELLVQWLRERLFVAQRPSQGDEDWQPPEKSQTLDGQFYFAALREGDDLASIVRVLHVIWQGDYWSYFRLLLGVIHELPTENHEYALRWRQARLQDLGFPTWEDALALYRHLDEKRYADLPEEADALDVASWSLPVYLPQLPEPAQGDYAVFRVIAQLEDEERASAFYAFVAVANGVAVADRMPLSDSETTAKAIAKAARFVDDGLAHLLRAHEIEAVEVLRRVPLAHLFRLGANLSPDEARPNFPSEAEETESEGEL